MNGLNVIKHFYSQLIVEDSFNFQTRNKKNSTSFYINNEKLGSGPGRVLRGGIGGRVQDLITQS